MAERKTITGTIEIDGIRHAFNGTYGGQNDAPGARLAWDAQIDGAVFSAGRGLVAYPGGFQGANDRAVACFVQDHFRGRARLLAFEARNGVAR